ncbi:hypothetical protein CA13_64960 [Planctomycetes bacterium CA13]|uniref:Uncharacterized protein n=1 Tax=Novipirellula herctigrandis TaxID=2527986 RepID=A0A5C5ZCG7_9BACT|nr:hypothetical protein CA13_64960 [Planctomycetes bacterium CA13]
MKVHHDSPRFSTLAILLLIMLLSFNNLYADDANAPVSTAPTVIETNTDTVSKAIQWSDLAPEGGKRFIDPFAKLSSVQIADLGYVVRGRRMIVDDKIEADGHDAKEAATLASQLKEQGVDIGWLMVQRKRVQQIRDLQAEKITFFSPEQKSKAMMVNSGAAQMLNRALKHDLIMKGRVIYKNT